MKKENIFNINFKLFIFGMLFLFILKLFFLKEINYILITSLYDLCIFGLLFFIFFNFKNLFFKITYYFLFYLNFFILSLYYIYFYDVYQRGSIVNVSLETTIFLFKNIISFKFILIIVIAILISLVFSKYLFKEEKLFITKNKIFILILLLLLVFLFLSIVLNVRYNPYADLIYEIENNFNVISLSSPELLIDDINNDKTITNYSFENIKYKKILIFIGEEWMFSDFLYEKESLSNNFYLNTKNNSFYYNNYFTTNQDSRTAIFSLLTSTFIPFEAYSSEKEYFSYLSKINTKNNLVDFFNYNDYNTYFLVSSIESPDIATPFNWTEILTLEKSVYDSKKYYCTNIFTYETSCEDFAVIDILKQKILEDENIFLVQEFIYGHSYKHIVDKKLSRTEYYNNYFLEVYSFLEHENLLDETLIIIVSDHGSRSINNLLDYEGYKIPLIFISSNITFYENFSLLSHLDFKDILFKHILNKDNIQENDSIMFVGGTGSNIIGFLTSNNTYGIINVSSNKLLRYSNIDNIKEISQNYYNYYFTIKNKFK